MKLLVLTEDFYPSVSGGAHARWRFAQLVSCRGHDVTVVTPRKPDTVSEEQVDGVEIRRPFPSHPSQFPPASAVATASRLCYSAALALWLRWWARSKAFDAVYSPSNTLHWVAATYGRRAGIPSASFIGYTPSLRPKVQPRAKLALERFNFTHGLADHVFCRVPEIRNLVEQEAGRRAELIDGVLNEARIRAAAGRAEDERQRYVTGDQRLLVVAGRLSEEKDVPAAVDMLHALPEEYRLVVVGDGPEAPEVRRTIKARGERERVTMVGQLSHEDTLATIAGADALLLPSHVEAYPTVVFEALALRSAVFATPVGMLDRVDHPDLNLGEVSVLADRVREAELTYRTGVDESVLDDYSMAAFADQLLGALAR